MENKSKKENDKLICNGHPYVDLGLPSGTLWSTMNVGASSPSDPGLYFQWGDTVGYKEDQMGKEPGKKIFEFDDYKWFFNCDAETFTKYTHRGETLDLEDDAAHINMGGCWHIPNLKQTKELINTANTRCDWVELDGISGMKITSKKDKSKYIFIPASGYAWSDSVYGIENVGSIWSSTLYDNINYELGQYLYFGPKVIQNRFSYRYYGFSVRGVIG